MFGFGNNALGSLMASQGQGMSSGLNAQRFNYGMQQPTPAMTPVQMYQQTQEPQRQVWLLYCSDEQEARNFFVNATDRFLFVNNKTGEMYLKYMNNDGTSSFEKYMRTDVPVQQPAEATVEERLARLEALLTKIGGRNESDEPNGAAAVSTASAAE